MPVTRLIAIGLAILPAPLRRHATPARVALLEDFARFCVVGLAGFAVDVATVYATRFAIGLYAAGLLAYLTSASVTWALNRAWTFRGHGDGPLLRQWAAFLAANALGFALNRGTYMALITWSELCAREPVFAIMAGVAAGLGANFYLSRRLVFRKR